MTLVLWMLAAAVGAVVALVLGVRFALLRHNRRCYALREVPGFLTDAECDHLIERARPLMQESAVVQEGRRGAQDEVRRSGTAFLDQKGDLVVQGIKRRIAELTGTRVEQQERIQITHYRAGERYGSHFDSLAASGLESGPGGDRITTVILYLNDDYRGGATRFPRIGRRVRPERGKAIVFGNLTADGERWEPLSVHEGEPVQDGEKWLSNQWIRQRQRWDVSTAPARGFRKRGKRARRS